MYHLKDTHWQAVKRVLRYLKATLHFGLFIPKSTTLQLIVYSDVDWGGIPDDHRSTTGYYIYFGSSLV